MKIPGVGAGSPTDADWQKVGELCLGPTKERVQEGEFAGVEGGAAGAGLSLALACDLIVAEEEAQFTASYVKAGLVPDGGLTVALAEALPRTLAMQLCVLGRPVSARRMYDLGVVNAVVPEGDVPSKVACIADVLSQGPREAEARKRRGLRGPCGRPLGGSGLRRWRRPV